jgi:nucleoid-associated protein YgaU
MALGRYNRNNTLAGGKQLTTNTTSRDISSAVSSGRVPVTRRVTQEGDRLDKIAGQVYGNSSLWWVIAAASGIGWGLQVPPGTLLLIPKSLDNVASALE